MSGSTLDVPAMEPVSLNVKFGKVAFGAETISVSASCARGAIPVLFGEPSIAAADRLLTQRRLDVVLTNETDQGDLFAEHDEGQAIRVRVMVETAGLSAGDKFGWTMNAKQNDLTQLQMDEITHLAQREGRLIIHDVSTKEASPATPQSATGEQPKRVAATPVVAPLAALIKRFADEKHPGNAVAVGVLMDRDSELVCTEKQTQAFIAGGYGTAIEIAELLSQDPDAAVEVLANTKGVTKKCAAAVVAAVKKLIERRQKPPGRLLCNCGELWDTFCVNDSPLGIEASRTLDVCPHCGNDEAVFRGVTDDRLDEVGDWPDHECERIDLATVGKCTAGILLVQDEFGAWRHGVAIDIDGEANGFSPSFTSVRRDRSSAVSQARIDLIHELRAQGTENSDVVSVLAGVMANKSAVV